MAAPLATVPLIHAVMFSGYGSAKRFLTESSTASDVPWLREPPRAVSKVDDATASHPHPILAVGDAVVVLDDEIDDSSLKLWQIGAAGGFSGAHLWRAANSTHTITVACVVARRLSEFIRGWPC